MSCSEYDLQGLHAGIYLARETDGRLGEYQCLPSTFRSSNAFYIVLILLAPDCFILLSQGSRRARAIVSDVRKTHTNSCIYLLPLPRRHASRSIGRTKPYHYRTKRASQLCCSSAKLILRMTLSY